MGTCILVQAKVNIVNCLCVCTLVLGDATLHRKVQAESYFMKGISGHCSLCVCSAAFPIRGC